MKRTRVVLVALAGLAAAALSSAPPSAGEASRSPLVGGPTLVKAPLGGFSVGTSPDLHRRCLKAVTAVSATDVWAVGSSPCFHLPVRTTAFNWNGETWSRVRTPSPGQGERATLDAVTSSSSDDVWAFGGYRHSGSEDSPLAERWDGAGWTEDTGEATPEAQLFGVDAVSRDDLWAVGQRSNDLGVIHPFIERWTGDRWKVVASHAPSDLSRLLAVSAVSPSDVWAVGENTYMGLVEHWDGRRWTQAL